MSVNCWSTKEDLHTLKTISIMGKLGMERDSIGLDVRILNSNLAACQLDRLVFLVDKSVSIVCLKPLLFMLMPLSLCCYRLSCRSSTQSFACTAICSLQHHAIHHDEASSVSNHEAQTRLALPSTSC
jgi:hypothetical protein